MRRYQNCIHFLKANSYRSIILQTCYHDHTSTQTGKRLFKLPKNAFFIDLIVDFSSKIQQVGKNSVICNLARTTKNISTEQISPVPFKSEGVLQSNLHSAP